jgi:peptidoglycan/LPS O-acetylase OafA/YrhL
MSAAEVPLDHGGLMKAVERLGPITNLSKGIANLPNRWQRRTTGHYRPEIDGLRFIAILIVVLGHMVEIAEHFYKGPRTSFDAGILKVFSAPGNGVFLFFAISGFIITAQYLKENSNPISWTFLTKYFKRRVLRIEPPYILIVVVSYLGLAATGFVPQNSHRFGLPPESLAVSFLASLLYSHGWLFGTFPRVFPPGWSLEIEVQFYLTAPLIFLAYFGIRNLRTRTILGLLFLIAGACVPIHDESQLPYGTVPHLHFTIVRFMSYFFIGVMAADLRPILARLPIRSLIIDILSIASAIVLFFDAALAPYIYPTANLLLKILVIFLMFIAAFTEGCFFQRIVSNPWISLLGGACYSIYLTHLQVIMIVTQVASKLLHVQSFALKSLLIVLMEIPAVLIVALAFYGAIERTFMRPDWPQLFREKLRLNRFIGSRVQAEETESIHV